MFDDARVLRFRSKYTVTDKGCWRWHGSFFTNGYGQFPVRYGQGRQKCFLAHRYSYELDRGPIPDGLVLDHLCRNRSCVNPAHLEAVTTRTNIIRGDHPIADQVTRTHCKRGGHPLSGPNLYVSPRGDRACRTCRADDLRAFRARRAARVPALP